MLIFWWLLNVLHSSSYVKEIIITKKRKFERTATGFTMNLNILTNYLWGPVIENINIMEVAPQRPVFLSILGGGVYVPAQLILTRAVCFQHEFSFHTLYLGYLIIIINHEVRENHMFTSVMRLTSPPPLPPSSSRK